MSISEIQSENQKAAQHKAFNINQMFSFLKAGLKSIETDDLLINYKKTDDGYSHEFGFQKEHRHEIVSVEFWNVQRDQWESSDILPEFLETELFKKAHEVLEKGDL